MPGSWRVRLQAALVLALFLASLGMLLFQSFAALGLPQRELRVRDQLRQAVGQLAQAAEPSAVSLSAHPALPAADLDPQLHQIAEQVLREFPGVEGGFFLAGQRQRFSAYAYPTKPSGPLPPPPRNDPPPLEAAYIQGQAQQSLSLDPAQALVDAQQIGPSRVIVAAAPVGREHPAQLAAWTMHRLTGPEDLKGQLSQFRWSIGLALGGMVFSLALTVNLVQTLNRQRREQDRLRDDLRRAEHLAALGKLLAGVAHEVRNPLAGIRSTVQLWQRLPETARHPDSLTAVIEAVDRLNEIVKRLLYFARVDNAERQPVSVNQVLAETLNLLEGAAILARGRLILADDLRSLTPATAWAASETAATPSLSLEEILAETEKHVIQQALEQANWNRTQSARLLGISRRQLFDKIQQYGLQQ